MLQLLRPRWGTRKSGSSADVTHARASHPGLSILVERGHLGPEAVEHALARAAETRQPLPVVLSELELLTGHEWAALMAERYGLQKAGPAELPTAPLLPETFEGDIAIMRQVLDEYRAIVAKGRG